jgi:vacuolar iron transporter family protein
MPRPHTESHLVTRIGWLRAGVLGANDGILSTASLIVGVASASSGKPAVMVAGLAGLVAGAMSMAAGEYVSVSSQADTETADIARETAELKSDPAAELTELARIYEGRGVSPALALQVAQEMTASGALAAHTRDELGITTAMAARPVQAGLVSAATFAFGAALPLLVAAALPEARIMMGVSIATLCSLVALGAIGARVGGASMTRGALRVTVWGALAMLATALVGWAFGTVL